MLQINDNQIEELGEDFSLRELRSLLIHNNLIAELPVAITDLKYLAQISLEWFVYLDPPAPKVLREKHAPELQALEGGGEGAIDKSEDQNDENTLSLEKLRAFVLECREQGFRADFARFMKTFLGKSSLRELSKCQHFPKKRYLLHALTANADLHLIRCLYSNPSGFDLNPRDEDGSTPLMLVLKKSGANKADLLHFFLSNKTVQL